MHKNIFTMLETKMQLTHWHIKQFIMKSETLQLMKSNHKWSIERHSRCKLITCVNSNQFWWMDHPRQMLIPVQTVIKSMLFTVISFTVPHYNVWISIFTSIFMFFFCFFFTDTFIVIHFISIVNMFSVNIQHDLGITSAKLHKLSYKSSLAVKQNKQFQQ